MASIAFGARVVAGDVYHEGISHITAADIEVARRLGYVVKLLAIAELDDATGEIAVRVHPAMVPRAPPAGERAGELQRRVRRGRRRRPADVLRPRRRRPADGERRARRRHRRRRQPDQGHPRHARLVRQGPHPPDRRDVGRVPARPRGRRRARRAARRHRRVRRPRRQHPRRRAGGHRRRRPPRVHHPRGPGVGRPGHRPRAARARRRAPRRRPAARHRRAERRARTSRRGDGRRSSASPTSCSPGWPPTAGCTCPAEWPLLPPPAELDAAASYADDGPARDQPRSSATTSRPPTWPAMCDEAYATFRHPAVVPLVQIDHRQWLAELFHGPTLAFKDVALQLVGRLFDHVLGAARRPRHDRRGDQRRHRLGGDRGGPRLRATSTS